MNIIQYLTLQIVDYSEPSIMGGDWEIISACLFILLGILVITTSLKSRKIKKQEELIELLVEELEEMEKQE